MLNWFKKLFGLKAKSVAITQKSLENDTKPNLLDCRNMNCPMPIIKISTRFKSMNVGDTLIVKATDPAFKQDINAWVRKTENELVSFQDDGYEKTAVLKKLK